MTQDRSIDPNGAFAHSANDIGRCHHLLDHLDGVARLVKQFAGTAIWKEEARLAARLHDFGKFGPRFQARLAGRDRGVDHWSAGAWLACGKGRCGAAALAILGHHLGLPAFMDIEIDKLQQAPERYAARDHAELFQAVRTALPPIKPTSSLLPRPKRPEDRPAPVLPCTAQVAAMLDVRALFSTLVDADFLDTEAHFSADSTSKRYREAGPALDAAAALAALQRYRDAVRQATRADPELVRLRDTLWQASLAAAADQPGLWTLSAPTGAGKTLAMLGFALAHAQAHGLRRIILVIPFLSIIEQTAKTLRGIFGDEFPDHFILEHHSLADARGREEDGRSNQAGDAEEPLRRQRRLLSENWDAPIIITTSVQFLESLFANRPGACRKLHRIRDSVVMFDEVQTLPQTVLIPTLAALSHLAAPATGAPSGWGCSVVLATATQPAFDHLASHVTKLSGAAYAPREIAPQELDLFGRITRTRVVWPPPTPVPADADGSACTSWASLADQMVAAPGGQALAVVNIKRHAWQLLDELKARVGSEGVFHLSTSMIPDHRTRVLATVRARLDAGQPCLLVSTQCIEAGVDVDFPRVWRAMAPLEAIAQAAGRCNREGRRPAEDSLVTVFHPPADSGGSPFPTPAYAQAAQVTQSLLLSLLRAPGPEHMHLDDPALFKQYYRELYQISTPEQADPRLIQAIEVLDFPAVAEQYRIIDHDTVSVIVLWFGQDTAREPQGLPADFAWLGADGYPPRGWQRRVQPWTVSLYRRAAAPLIASGRMTPLPFLAARTPGAAEATDWYLYQFLSDYDPLKGLMPSNTLTALIG